MGQVVLEITMSVDDFAAGPDVGRALPMGEGGERIHAWLGGGAGSESAAEGAVANETFASTGAFVMGRRTFDVGEEPWGDDDTLGVPCFVVTHRQREQLVKGPTTFTFVTDGVESAVDQARTAAGDQDVVVMGGADIAQQSLRAGLLDEMRLHLAPVLLGAGTRLFDNLGGEHIELERTSVIESPFAMHLKFRVVGASPPS